MNLDDDAVDVIEGKCLLSEKILIESRTQSHQITEYVFTDPQSYILKHIQNMHQEAIQYLRLNWMTCYEALRA